MDHNLVQVVDGFLAELREADDHIKRLGLQRWIYYVDAGMEEVRRCELAGWQFEAIEMLILQEALIWCL